MMYSWGLDRMGRQHICLSDPSSQEVLFCVLPGYSALDCIEILIAQCK